MTDELVHTPVPRQRTTDPRAARSPVTVRPLVPPRPRCDTPACTRRPGGALVVRVAFATEDRSCPPAPLTPVAPALHVAIAADVLDRVQRGSRGEHAEWLWTLDTGRRPPGRAHRPSLRDNDDVALPADTISDGADSAGDVRLGSVWGASQYAPPACSRANADSHAGTGASPRQDEPAVGGAALAPGCHGRDTRGGQAGAAVVCQRHARGAPPLEHD